MSWKRFDWHPLGSILKVLSDTCAICNCSQTHQRKCSLPWVSLDSPPSVLVRSKPSCESSVVSSTNYLTYKVTIPTTNVQYVCCIDRSIIPGGVVDWCRQISVLSASCVHVLQTLSLSYAGHLTACVPHGRPGINSDMLMQLKKNERQFSTVGEKSVNSKCFPGSGNC